MKFKITPKVKKWIELADQLKTNQSLQAVSALHLLASLPHIQESEAFKALNSVGADWEDIQKELVETRPQEWQVNKENPSLEDIIKKAGEITSAKNETHIPSENMLLAMLENPESTVVTILARADVKIPALDAALNGGLSDVKSAKTPALDAFGTNLCKLAKNDKLDPVIGRDEEIMQMIQILCRRTKNNPVLVGEAGVGKTAVVEGLASKIVNGDIPEILANKQVICLDMARMVAGTKYRGQFEERLTAVMKEVRENKNIILFLDELHTIVGAGSASGSMDASNILKPALSRGELQCVGATTRNEFHKYIEKDAALTRRFQQVTVDEPTVAQTVLILKGLRSTYQKHHQCSYSDAALEAAATLSARYLTNKQLPDKAIDLMDEAGSRLRMQYSNQPEEELKAKLRKIALEKEEAVQEGSFEVAKNLKKEEDKVGKALLKVHKHIPEVTDKTIGDVLSKITGIPIHVDGEEQRKVLEIDTYLQNRIIGQPNAIDLISKAIKRSSAGIKDPKRPIGSFLLLGPTGVGKTHTAKNLAGFLFGDEDAIIQIDMSEYMEKHNTSRLIGAPPGYVGYGEGGQLSEAVRRKPYSVILFDEIEKAHPDVLNLLLQVLEEGQLTDSLKRKVDFRNTLILMTSNVGAANLKKSKIGFVAESDSDISSKFEEDAKKCFKPEFLNRLTAVVPFLPLGKESLANIIDIEIAKIQKRVDDRSIKIVVSDTAQSFLIDKGYSEEYGARPMRRVVERHIEDVLSEEILAGHLAEKSTITFSLQDGKLVHKVVKEQNAQETNHS